MKKTVIVLLGITLALIVFMIYSIVGIPYLAMPLTGNSVFGSIAFYVIASTPSIHIDSPLNVTYNFAIVSNLTLPLNVSANQKIVSWWYNLYSLYLNVTINSSIPFSPNTTIAVVRRSNNLTVFGQNADGTTGSASVVFYVSVPNSAPILGNISDRMYVCEGNALNYQFNATDPDMDNLQVSLSPTSPFFVYPTNFFTQTFIQSTLFSGVLTKSQTGYYSRTISVSDGQYADSKKINITVIPINNLPLIAPIGVQTIYLNGTNTLFYKQIVINDVEDGDANSGNFTFNLTFNNGNKFFDIDKKTGIMNVTANLSILGVWNLTVCAVDQALKVIPPNISLCGQTGLNNTVCTNFSLTVTNTNRAPVILTYSPRDKVFNATDGQFLSFGVSTFDPDGTIPDIYWYLDGHKVAYTSGLSDDSFNYSFPCNLSGTHYVKTEITDGIANDSVQWNITVFPVLCSAPISKSGGGGGGGGGNLCVPKWGCDEWPTCQSTERSLKVGLIGGDDYRLVTDQCDKQGLDTADCGLQIRTCSDFNNCSLNTNRPALIQACKYISNPSCSDGVQDCHDGTCEVGIDCGGPCASCPTCSDGKQNQGELGIDCGGPCPTQCPAESPMKKYNFMQSMWFISLLWILLLILLIVLGRRVYKLIKERNRFEKERRIQSVFSSKLH